MRGFAVVVLGLLLAGCVDTPQGRLFGDFRLCNGAVPAGEVNVRVQLRDGAGKGLPGACLQAWPLPLDGDLHGVRAGEGGDAVLRLEPGPWRLQAHVPFPDDPACAWTNETELDVREPATVLLVLGPAAGRMACA